MTHGQRRGGPGRFADLAAIKAEARRRLVEAQDTQEPGAERTVATIQQTAQAEADLIDIWLHIAPDDVQAADRLLDDLDETLLLLADQPFLGSARPDVAPGASTLKNEKRREPQARGRPADGQPRERPDHRAL
jgi:plasmid stabilization system protein ParE